MKLRQYQERFVDDIRGAFTRQKRVLGVMPTGAGKTACFSYVARGTAQKQKRVLILTHRDFLHRQVCQALESWGVGHGKLKGGSRFLTRNPVTVASVFTLVNRLDRFIPPDLIIIDEAHHVAANRNSWHKVLDKFPDAFVLGVTATPIRADGNGLGDLFKEMVVGPQTIELIIQGYLSAAEVYAPSDTLDLRGVTVRGGDFVIGELDKTMGKPKITGDAVSHYTRITPNKQAVAFCCSIEHAEKVADAFNAAGYVAEAVHGKMDQFDIDQVFMRYDQGKTKIVTACNLISEGFDMPAIEVVILLRPTKSLGLYLQMVGRGIRPSPGKEKTVVLDHAGCTAMHGFVDEIRPWELTGSIERQIRAPSVVGARICKFCFAYFPTADVCPVCGTPVITDGRKVDHVDGELAQMTSAADLLAAVEAESQEQSYEILLKIARGRGMPNPEGWAYAVLSAKTAQSRKERIAFGERTVNGLTESEHQALRDSVNRAMSKEA